MKDWFRIWTRTYEKADEDPEVGAPTLNDAAAASAVQDLHRIADSLEAIEQHLAKLAGRQK